MMRWWRGFLARFAWEPVYFSAELEIEQNSVTGLYRHRGLRITENDIIADPWAPGLPDNDRHRVSLDDLMPPAEMAKRLVPLWGEDDRRKADND